MSYHRTHLAARHMSDRLLLACYDKDKADLHLRQARQNFLLMLAQESGTVAWVQDALIDIIENAIADVHDEDVTFNDYAVSVVAALLNNVVPMPEEGQ